MRNLVTLKSCSVCLLVLGAAACRDPAANNAAGNETNVVSTNEVVPAPVNIAEAAGFYQAFDTEPCWWLTISRGRMRYRPQEGPRVSEPLPARTPIANGYRYVGTRMTVQVVHMSCYEAGEGSYPDAVDVTVGGRTYRGCGMGSGELG